jgi:hypothetical protein
LNNLKEILPLILKQPIEIEYSQHFTMTQKIAGFILFSFFIFLGGSIFLNGLEEEENRLYYILFGILLCAIPFILYLIIINSKNKSIVFLDKDSVILKNNKKYNWNDLHRITYHTSLYARNENERYVSIEFIFKNGSAFAPYSGNTFLNILNIAAQLPVPKNELATTRFK